MPNRRHPTSLYVAAINTTTRSNLWRKGFSSPYSLSVHCEGKSEQELNQEQRQDHDGGHGGVLLTDLLLVACSACFLIDLRDSNTPIVWAIFYQLLIKKMTYNHILQGHFLN